MFIPMSKKRNKIDLAFSSYYRMITDLFPNDTFETLYFLKNKSFLKHLFIFLLVFQAVFIVGYYFASTVYVQRVIERDMLKKEFEYWRRNAESYQNSADVLFNASYYAAKLGDRELALYYLEESLEIEPSFERAESLMRELGY